VGVGELIGLTLATEFGCVNSGLKYFREGKTRKDVAYALKLNSFLHQCGTISP
jgi:hypothetical protein